MNAKMSQAYQVSDIDIYRIRLDIAYFVKN